MVLERRAHTWPLQAVREAREGWELRKEVTPPPIASLQTLGHKE